MPLGSLVGDALPTAGEGLGDGAVAGEGSRVGPGAEVGISLLGGTDGEGAGVGAEGSAT